MCSISLESRKRVIQAYRRLYFFIKNYGNEGMVEMFPYKGQSRKSFEFYTKKLRELEEKLERKLGEISKLPSDTPINTIQEILPLPYLFLLPVRHGMVMYAIYSRKLSNVKGKPVPYSTLVSLLNLNFTEIDKDWGYSPFLDNIFPELIRSTFKLYHLARPFRILLGKPVQKRKKKKQPPKTVQRKIKRNTKLISAEIHTMKEWKQVSSPGKIVYTVGRVWQKYGFEQALKFTCGLFRISEKIANIISGKKSEEINQKRMKKLTKRYLTIT